MSNQRDSELESVLDLCIDEMLSGSDWKGSIPEGSEDEIDPLMKIAQKLQEGGTPADLNSGHEKRIWARISQVLKLPARLIVWRPEPVVLTTLQRALSYLSAPRQWMPADQSSLARDIATR